MADERVEVEQHRDEESLMNDYDQLEKRILRLEEHAEALKTADDLTFRNLNFLNKAVLIPAELAVYALRYSAAENLEQRKVELEKFKTLLSDLQQLADQLGVSASEAKGE